MYTDQDDGAVEVSSILCLVPLFGAADTLTITITIQDALAVEETIPLPEQFEVSAPYPNPFNPVVTINVAIPQPTNTIITMYDLKGRFVDNLYRESLEAGWHPFTWDGSAFTSGIYILTVNTELGSKSFKLLLLK